MGVQLAEDETGNRIRRRVTLKTGRFFVSACIVTGKYLPNRK
jgi:hypothetical protein